MKVYVIFVDIDNKDSCNRRKDRFVLNVATTIDAANTFIMKMDAGGDRHIVEESKEWGVHTNGEEATLEYRYTTIYNSAGDKMHHKVYWKEFDTID